MLSFAEMNTGRGGGCAELKLNENQLFCVQYVNSEMPLGGNDKPLEIRREAGDKH